MSRSIAARHCRSRISALCATSAVASRAITVGTEDIESQLTKSTRRMAAGAAADQFIVVSADWGDGKSHLKNLLSEHLRSSGVPFVIECVDGRASSLSHMHRLLPKWLEQIRIGPYRGLREAFLTEHLSSATAIEWTKLHPTTFGWGLREGLEGVPSGWITALGHRFRSPDYAYQHPKALGILFGCANMLNDLGMGGIVVILDEMENVDKQYSICGRRNSYATLARLSRHPHILPVLFVTPRFVRQIKDDCVQGANGSWFGWYHEAAQFVRAFPEHEILSPPAVDRDTGRRIVDKIALVFATAYGEPPPGFDAQRVVNAWMNSATRSVRSLVRLTAGELDMCRQMAATAPFPDRSNGHPFGQGLAQTTIATA